MTQTPEIIHSYEADTAQHGFFNHAARMFGYVPRCLKSRALLWNFARRELLGRFRGSAGGIFWVLVQPIFQFTIFFLVFGILFAPRDDLMQNGPSTVYALYLFSGILLFNTVIEGSNAALSSVIQNANLVKKVAFPCELLPLTPVLVSTVVYLVGCIVLLVVGLALGDLQLGAGLLAWPVLVACMLVFATGLGLLLASANVFARDVGHLYAILGQAWFFLSPVFWRLPLIQEKADAFDAPWAMHILLLNPVYCMLMAQRQIVGLGHEMPPAEYLANFPLGLWQNIGFSVIWAGVMFFIGYGFFMSRKHKFADLV